MTDIDVKTVGELLRSVGPTEEHRQKFGQTFPGSLLGQAVVAVGLGVLYCLLLTLLFLGGQQLTPAHERWNPIWFWAAVAAPLVLTLLFRILPTFWQAAVVEMRPVGDPTEGLRAVLLKTKGIFTRKPAAELPPWEHLKKPADACFKAGTSCLDRESQQRHGSSAGPKMKSSLQGGTQWSPNPSM